ncbi:MAG: uracil-DNA glycosylase [Pyrinomonadaceae bacterium]
MESQNQTDELISLIRSTREQLVYLKELGVENTEPQRARAVCNEISSPQAGSVTQQQIGVKPVGRSSVPAVAAAMRAEAHVSDPYAGHGTLFGDLKPPPVTIRKSSETFEHIWSEIGCCMRCPLYEGRTNIVHTEGNRSARLMFVGEAPGADEDVQARPFVGRAGKLLTKIIEAIGFKREEVLIGNVNRCRPPGNRPPTPEEASICKPFLLREIEAVQPEVIVVLGNTAMRNLLDIKQGITKVRGQFQDYQGVKVMPTFHPAYLLRDPSKKQETWDDLKKVRDYLATTPRRTS